jgi:hypothetical protein
MVLKHWVASAFCRYQRPNTPVTLPHYTGPRVQVDTNILCRIKEFALSITTSATMTKLANEVVAAIDKRVRSIIYFFLFLYAILTVF